MRVADAFSTRDVFGGPPPQAPAGIGATARPIEATGRSPDGIGATAQPIGAGPDGLGAELEWLEPDDVSTGAAVRTAGITALASALALGAGLAMGGPWGAGAGVLLVGAAFNGYRAQKWWGSPDPSAKHEAVVSGVMAALSVGVGGWMVYRAVAKKRED